MIELSQKGSDVKRGFGGDTLNTSVYLSRLVAASQLKVHYITAPGTYSFSDDMLQALQQEVETSLIQRLENRLPGLYYIETDAHGERTFIIGAMKRPPVTGWKARRRLTFAPRWQTLITFI